MKNLIILLDKDQWYDAIYEFTTRGLTFEARIETAYVIELTGGY